MSQGAFAKMLMDATTSFDTESEAYAFISENLRQSVELDIDPSIRGTRSRAKERSGMSLKRVGGDITFRPSPTELDRLLPRMLGAAESTDTFAVAETLPEFSVLINKVAYAYQYDGCKVGTARFTGQESQAIQLALSLFGKTRTKVATGSFPAVAIDTDTYYSFFQGVLTLDGDPYLFNQFDLLIDNLVEVLFENSVTASTVEAADRNVTLSVNVPFNSASSDLQDAIDNAETIAASLVFTNGGQSLTFTMPALMVPDEDPVVSGKSKIRYPLNFTALSSGSNKEIVVTHDSTA